MGKEKKEIWKLLELLNERIKEWWKPYWDDYSIAKIDEIWKSDWLYFVSFVWEDYPWPVNLEHLLTKQAGLIKWLVENDKIDRDKCWFKNEWLSWNWYDSGIAFVQNYDNDTFKISEFYSPYLQLLMLLSISDTPIEDLLLYLK